MARAIDSLYRVNVSHLTEDEIDYELSIRGLATNGTIPEKERSLRAQLRTDEKDNREYTCDRSMSEEAFFIEKRIGEIENRIVSMYDLAAKSRLYHYLKRILRCVVTTDEEEKTRYELLETINELLQTYFEETYSESSLVGPPTEQTRNATETSASTSLAVASATGPTEPNKNLGAIPKKSNRQVTFSRPGNELISPPNQRVNDSENTTSAESTDRVRKTNEERSTEFSNSLNTRSGLNIPNPEEYVHISEIDKYVQKCVTSILSDYFKDNVNHIAVNRITNQVLNDGIRDTEVMNISSGQQKASLRSERRRLSVVPGNLKIPESVRQSSLEPPFNRRIFRDSNIACDSSFGLNNIRNPFETSIQNENTIRQCSRPPHEICKIINTWPKFNGDHSSTPLVSFLRTIDMFCRSYQIDKEDLKPHAHLLFSGDAYTWYVTYVEKFTNWESLLYYLNLRYDNPNRDRFVKEEMRNRKQKPNELFSAFLTDIEALSQRLMKPMSEVEKFELIVENMKMSYKRRLALEDIQSIEDLAQKCYRFDALEANLFNQYSRVGNPYVNSVEQETRNEVREAKSHRPTTNFRSQVEVRNRFSNERKETGCWNCSRTGHCWRDCRERRTVFCHICGFRGRITINCPNKHNFPKNEPRRNN